MENEQRPRVQPNASQGGERPGDPPPSPRNPLTPNPNHPDPGERSPDPAKQPKIHFPSKEQMEEIPTKPTRDVPHPEPERDE